MSIAIPQSIIDALDESLSETALSVPNNTIAIANRDHCQLVLKALNSEQNLKDHAFAMIFTLALIGVLTKEDKSIEEMFKEHYSKLLELHGRTIGPFIRVT